MERTFKIFDFILSIGGITIYDKRKWDSTGWFIFQILNVVLGFQIFICALIFVITNLSNLLLCIQGACILFTGFVLFTSLFVCFFFKKDLQGFVDEMAYNDRTLDLPLVQYVLSLDVTCGKLYELKCLIMDSQVRMARYAGIFVQIYIASKWKLFDRLFSAFDMWFPWSLDNFAVYMATFIVNAYEGYLCGVALCSLKSTISLLVYQIIRQLEVITFTLTYLDDMMVEITGQRDQKWQNACTLVLSQCVDHYVKTKRFSNRLNVICQPFYLALILVAIMIVCVCTVKIAVSHGITIDAVKYCLHALCFIVIIFLFSFLGQQLENQCEKLEVAVMEKWYIYDKKHKVNVLIFNIALSQRMPIYIFGSIPLYLPTFTWFMNTVMSFFTLVMSVIET
ncbi:uncharacterized protein LOC119836586 [Zerene cesonia]|uniref:uncharacterized protein LOC119836586 n=1 Tax=Zerene cesonia TaxID=33412 RepID=UPI0018E4E59F|nr:uncharacterized protein LOC119836586 [Zerene cesonia]